LALAWLNLLDVDREALRFAIDTGTSRYYQLRVGRARSTREGVDWVDGVYLTTPMKPNDAGGSLLPAIREVTVPASRLDRGDSYVQLVTYKAPDGRGPAFSEVVSVPGAPELRGRLARHDVPAPGIPAMTPSRSMSVARSMRTPSDAPGRFQSARKIPCVRSPDSISIETSIEDVLSSIVKVAGPAVLKLLGTDGEGGGAPASGGNASDSSPVTGVVSFLLKTLLAGLQPSATPTTANPPSPPNPANPQKDVAKSLSASMALAENRFAAAKRTAWSRPFIFGIDDAIIGALAGPILNVLPQLVNSANQQRLQTQQANNKLITDALTQVNQRMLMEQLLAAQQKAQGDQAAQLAALQQQLQALAEASDKPKSQSLAMSAPTAVPSSSSATPSARATLAFVTAEPVQFDGKPHLLFTRSRDAELKLRLVVGDPAPARPLPRAILAVTLKGGPHAADWVKIEERLTDVAASGVQTITIAQADLAKLPANRRIAVIAELRWPGSSGTTRCATGSTEIVLADKYFVRERGATVGEERELTDMGQYRPFWNKVWEAPALDASNRAGGGRAKSLWELDVDARYLVLLSPHEDANGVMETRLSASPSDPDEIRLTTSGRLKGGIELSFDEVNKLAGLFGGSALDAERLAALRSHSVARAESGEFVASIKLKGRANERGMVWVVPVFRLAEFTLSAIQKTDDSGQVVAVTSESVRLPVPVAARVLGLRSQGGEGTGDGSGDGAKEPSYQFDGYTIDVSQKVALTPIADRRRRPSAPAATEAAVQRERA
jgi:hypothetical protein